MRGWVLMGCGLVAAGAVACGSWRAQEREPLSGPEPVAVSAGAGGGADVERGQWVDPRAERGQQRERRALYEEVARELGLEPWPEDVRGQRGEALGGGGRAGQEKRECAEVLAAQERAALVAGTLSFASEDVLTLHVPGQGPMTLRADASTCAVQAGHALPTASLREGTEARIAYVLEEGVPTARVVHARPERALR